MDHHFLNLPTPQSHTAPGPSNPCPTGSGSSFLAQQMSPSGYGISNTNASNDISALHGDSTDSQAQTSLIQQLSPQDSKRRRYRIPRSCDRCRASKIKCVFEDGRCAACSASGVSCTFANPGSLRERPPTQKDVEHLQARIRSLERLIHAVAPSIDLLNLPRLDQLKAMSQVKTLTHGALTGETHQDDDYQAQARLWSYSPPEENNDTENPLVTPIWSSAHWTQPDNSPSSGKFVGITFESAHYVGTNGVFSLPDSATNEARALISPSNQRSSELSPVDKIIRNLFQQRILSTQHFYPEPDLEHHLLSLYFTNIHPLQPILHPPTFIQLHSAGLAQTDSSFRCLCLFAFALASRFSDDPRVMLDIDGTPHSNRQIAGLRYCFSASCYLYRPIAMPASLYDLQAFVLLCMYSLGTVSPMSSWSIAGIGLQRAQEVGAHRQDSHIWKADKLRDHLRRKTFFALYQFDNTLSGILGRTPCMQEEDYDLTPIDPDIDITFGTFTTPSLAGAPVSRDAEIEFYRSITLLITGTSGCRAVLPVLNALHACRDKPGVDKMIKTVKPLVNKMDASLREWYSNLSPQLRDTPVAPDFLLASATILTQYHQYRLIIHRTLFDYACDDKSSMSLCVSAASSIIHLTNQLRAPNMLRHAFIWAPLRVTSAAIVLICYIRKERHTLSVADTEVRRHEITIALEILNELAPSTYIAQTSARLIDRLVNLLASIENARTPPGNPFDPSQVTNAAFAFSSTSMLPTELNFSMWPQESQGAISLENPGSRLQPIINHPSNVI